MADFESIYNKYQPFIYRYLLRLSKNETLAEELTQDTFFRAYMNVAKLRDESKISVWLCQIAKNVYFAWYNENKRSNPIDSETDIKDDFDIEEQFLDKELTRSAFICLHQLEEPYKEVFMLAVLGQQSLAEISKLFGKSESWARVTFYRAKQKLAERMRNK